MDPETVDQNYAQLQQQGQQTAGLIQALAGKLRISILPAPSASLARSTVPVAAGEQR